MSSEDSDSRPPLWKFVTIGEKISGGGNVRFTCNYCNRQFTGSYARVKSHLLKTGGLGICKCVKVSSDDLVIMQREQGEFETRAARVLPKQVPLPPSNSRTNSFSSSASTGTSMGTRLQGHDPLPNKRKKVTGDTPLEMAFNVQARQDLDSEIARMFYSSGLAFSLAKNPYYISSYTRAANSKHLAGYVPPGYNALRTSLLVKERRHIEGLLEPLKMAWKEKGVSIVSDGWTDAQRRPIINFMAASEGGPMFLQAVNCEGEYKDKYFIFNLLKEVISSVGHQNVVQVITDNAPVCRSAGLLIENQFPNIFWTPCVVHTLNLALKNICAAKNTQANAETYEECSWITDVTGEVMAVKNFIVNHSMRLSMFNANSQLKLLSVAETRFASSIIMLKRFKVIKQGLLSVLIRLVTVREFASTDSISNRGCMDPDLWWITYGSSTPLLQNLALKLLGQPCSSSCCERNWSTYSFINSLLRNKITPQRGEDLVFVHSNLRLLSRQSPEYIKGESSMWDLGGDGFDTLDDVGILGMANLSLDEPEMEAMLFTTDDIVDVEDD